METERKYENGNGNLQNGNGNGIFYAEMETKMKQRFPAEQVRKWNFPFPLIWNFSLLIRALVYFIAQHIVT